MFDAQHDKAMELSTRADEMLRAGDRTGALRLYAEAAEIELRSFEAAGADKPRTRAILAVSHVSLLFCAWRFGDAVAATDRYLDDTAVRERSGGNLRRVQEHAQAMIIAVSFDDRQLAEMLWRDLARFGADEPEEGVAAFPYPIPDRFKGRAWGDPKASLMFIDENRDALSRWLEFDLKAVFWKRLTSGVTIPIVYEREALRLSRDFGPRIGGFLAHLLEAKRLPEATDVAVRIIDGFADPPTALLEFALYVATLRDGPRSVEWFDLQKRLISRLEVVLARADVRSTCPQLWGLLAFLQDRLDEREKSIATLERARELFPQEPQIMADLGVDYHLIGKEDAAIPLLEAAVSKGVHTTIPYLILGNNAIAFGNFSAALELAEQALAKRPGGPLAGTAHLLKAVALDGLSAARSSVRKALEAGLAVSPDHEGLRTSLEAFRNGEPLVKPLIDFRSDLSADLLARTEAMADSVSHLPDPVAA